MKFKVGDLVRSALRKEFGLVMRVRPPVDATIEPVLYVLYASGRTGYWFESDLKKVCND